MILLPGWHKPPTDRHQQSQEVSPGSIIFYWPSSRLSSIIIFVTVIGVWYHRHHQHHQIMTWKHSSVRSLMPLSGIIDTTLFIITIVTAIISDTSILIFSNIWYNLQALLSEVSNASLWHFTKSVRVTSCVVCTHVPFDLGRRQVSQSWWQQFRQ